MLLLDKRQKEDKEGNLTNRKKSKERFSMVTGGETRKFSLRGQKLKKKTLRGYKLKTHQNPHHL